MKSAVFAGLLLFAVTGNVAIYVAGTATASSGEERSRPRRTEPAGPVVAEPAAVDLGDLKIGESKEFSVRLRNTGQRPVSLTDISAGCACTDVEVENSRLAEGEATIVRGRFRGKPDAGPFEVQLRIATDESEKPGLFVPISGTILSRFPLSSKEVVLAPSLVAGTPGTAAVTIRNDSGGPVELMLPRLPEGLSLTIDRPSLAPGESTTLGLTAAPEQVTEHDIALSLGTGHPDEPVVGLSVLLRPVSPIAVTPAVLHLGVLTREQLLARAPFELTLRGTSAGGLKIVDVGTPPFFRADLTRSVEADGFAICLVPTETELETDLRGAVEIVCRCRQSAKPLVVRVPVSGFLKN